MEGEEQDKKEEEEEGMEQEEQDNEEGSNVLKRLYKDVGKSKITQ